MAKPSLGECRPATFSTDFSLSPSVEFAVYRKLLNQKWPVKLGIFDHTPPCDSGDFQRKSLGEFGLRPNSPFRFGCHNSKSPAKRRAILNTPTETQLERSSIPVEQFLGLLNFENKVKLAELPGGIGASVRHGKK